MLKKTVKIVNPTGLHTRPGNRFVKLAKEFECSITVSKGEKEANAKSLLKVMKIGISMGNEIEIVCDGSDEQKAMDSLCDFIANLTE